MTVERRVAALWACVALTLPVLAGCLASPAPGSAGTAAPVPGGDADEPQPPGDPAPSNASRSSAVDARSRPSGDEAEEVVTDVKADPSHGSAWVNFTVTRDAAAHVRVGTDNLSRRVNVTEGPGAKRAFVGFLQPNTTYRYRIAAETGAGSVSASGSFATEPSPWSWATPDDALIRPGIQINVKGGEAGCTMAFVLRNPRNTTLYALTAGHCVDDSTEGVYRSLENREVRVGTVAAFQTAEEGLDWALIRLNASNREKVSPAVRHWTGPVGLTAGRADYDDRVCMYGQGQMYDFWERTRPRCGRFEAYESGTVDGANVSSAVWRGPGDAGDSGAPVLHHPTGTALAIMAGGTPPYGLMEGATVCSVLDLAEMQGFRLGLATWRHDPPEPRPTPPNVERVFDSAPSTCTR